MKALVVSNEDKQIEVDPITILAWLQKQPLAERIQFCNQVFIAEGHYTVVDDFVIDSRF